MGTPRSILFLVLIAVGVASCAGVPEPSRALTSQGAADGASGWPRAHLESIKKKIYGIWSYPCLPNAETGGCDRKAAELFVEAELHDDGRLGALRVVRSSGIPLYDDTAMNAIRLAAPFDAPPEGMSSPEPPPWKILMHFMYAPDKPPKPR
jgi:TonB family protein